MKATQLIAKLQELVKEHGDLEVEYSHMHIGSILFKDYSCEGVEDRVFSLNSFVKVSADCVFYYK